MLRLERLESLREDMQELGIESLDQLEQIIGELHAKLDDMESEA